MTDSKLMPAVQETLDKNNLSYKVLNCLPEFADTAAFVEHYNLDINQTANTILVASKKVEPTKYSVCVVSGTHRLDVNKAVCKLMGVKRASFADADTTKKLTGMEIGGVTAIGITNLPIYVDANVLKQKEVVMGGGNRTSKLQLNPQELTKLKNVEVVEGLAQPKQ